MKTKLNNIVTLSNIGTGTYNGKKYHEIMVKAAEEIQAKRSPNSPKIGMLMIDCQGDFVNPTGSLPVQGACEDVGRIIQFLYQHLYEIEYLYCTMDWHHQNQIFFPDAWVNETGNHPEPFTVMTASQIEDGIWQSTLPDPQKAVRYVKEVEKKGFSLKIWPYHCMEYTPGAAVEVELANMIAFHDTVWANQTQYIPKGSDTYTEMYGAIEAEFDEKGAIQQAVLDILTEVDTLIVVGEAGSHCVLRTLQQFYNHYATQPNMLQKIVVFEDGTSAIQGSEELMREGFTKLKKAGIQFMKMNAFKI